MWLNNVIYEDRLIENERLELVDENALYFLGDNLTLRRCTLVLRVPAQRFHVNKTRIFDSTIETQLKLKNFQWNSVHVKGCRFLGHFSGNDFGSWRDTPGESSIEDCDFSAAQLDATRFLGCDVRTLRLPSWPCFTLYEPVSRWRALSALPWPGDIGRVVIQGLAESPVETVAVTFSAPELAKRYSTTPDAIKAVLEKLDGVYY